MKRGVVHGEPRAVHAVHVASEPRAVHVVSERRDYGARLRGGGEQAEVITALCWLEIRSS